VRRCIRVDERSPESRAVRHGDGAPAVGDCVGSAIGGGRGWGGNAGVNCRLVGDVSSGSGAARSWWVPASMEVGMHTRSAGATGTAPSSDRVDEGGEGKAGREGEGWQ